MSCIGVHWSEHKGHIPNAGTQLYSTEYSVFPSSNYAEDGWSFLVENSIINEVHIAESIGRAPPATGFLGLLRSGAPPQTRVSSATWGFCVVGKRGQSSTTVIDNSQTKNKPHHLRTIHGSAFDIIENNLRISALQFISRFHHPSGRYKASPGRGGVQRANR